MKRKISTFQAVKFNKAILLTYSYTKQSLLSVLKVEMSFKLSMMKDHSVGSIA